MQTHPNELPGGHRERFQSRRWQIQTENFQTFHVLQVRLVVIAGIELVIGSFLQFRQRIGGGRVEIDDWIAVDQEFDQTEEENAKVDGPDEDENSDRMQRWIVCVWS